MPKKSKGGPFCFGMVLYFLLEVLNAFKIKYLVLMVNVPCVHKKWTIQSKADKKLVAIIVGLSFLKGKCAEQKRKLKIHIYAMSEFECFE